MRLIFLTLLFLLSTNSYAENIGKIYYDDQVIFEYSPEEGFSEFLGGDLFTVSQDLVRLLKIYLPVSQSIEIFSYPPNKLDWPRDHMQYLANHLSAGNDILLDSGDLRSKLVSHEGQGQITLNAQKLDGDQNVDLVQMVRRYLPAEKFETQLGVSRFDFVAAFNEEECNVVLEDALNRGEVLELKYGGRIFAGDEVIAQFPDDFYSVRGRNDLPSYSLSHVAHPSSENSYSAGGVVRNFLPVDKYQPLLGISAEDYRVTHKEDVHYLSGLVVNALLSGKDIVLNRRKTRRAKDIAIDTKDSVEYLFSKPIGCHLFPMGCGGS